MSIKGVDIMLNNNIELELFQTLMQRITFTPCIPLTTLCEFSYRCEMNDTFIKPESTLYEEDTDIIIAEYNKAHKRYKRLLKRLSVEKSSDVKSYMKPKIYDEFMLEKQVKIYNSFSDVIGYKRIEKIFPISLIQSAAFLDDAQPDYEIIAKQYPYFLPKHMLNEKDEDKREYFEGVNFFEFVLLLNLDVNVRFRSLNTLTNPLKTDINISRAKKMANKLIDSIKSEEMFKVYLYTFYDVFENLIHRKHNKKAEEYIQIVWLPEKYKKQMNKFKALETHLKDKDKMLIGTHERNQLENIIKRENAYEQMMTFRKMLDYYGIETIGEEIMPLTWAILFQLEDLERFKGTLEYIWAEEYAQIIKNYINDIILEVESFIKFMYIDNNSPLMKEE